MVSIYLTKSLREVLEFNNIDPDTDYAPAYNGESAGLDLYNCGDTVTISSAKGTFRLDNEVVGWDADQASLYGFTFTCSEAV